MKPTSKHTPKHILTALSLMLVSLPALAQISAPTMRGEITTAVSHIGNANLLTHSVTGVPSVRANVSNINQIKTIIINANQGGNTKLDVSLIDDFLDDVAPNARHYPPNFPNRTAEFTASENIKYLSDWLEPYASASDVSLEVIMRAAKINGMARNLNIGTEYTQRANKYMAQAISLAPEDAEANFLYGMMITEGGGFIEGQKYLQKAASLGYLEAEQSLAQAELLADNQSAALARLKDLQARHPNNAQINEQVRIVENGGFYIWNIKDNALSIKPLNKTATP